MSERAFGWESLLHTDASADAVLKAALLTTYERADERLLAEHLLPLLLRLSREPESEGAERQIFVMELDQQLKRLHGRIFVVSSMGQDAGDDAPIATQGDYPWIWRSIRQLFVGRLGEAVQHAKLWVFHWQEESGAESVEIVVSSANLTMSAFKGQLQGAWRACVPLFPRPALAREKTWGILPEFIRELARASGEGDQLSKRVVIIWIKCRL
jgi:hypothetical protein